MMLGIAGASAWAGLILFGICAALYLKPVGMAFSGLWYFALPILGLVAALSALWLLRKNYDKSAFALALTSVIPGAFLFISNSLVIVMNAGVDVSIH